MIHKQVASSNIESVGYEEGEERMQIKFRHGGVHEYSGVPVEVHERLMGARSIGGFVHDHIKGKYASEKKLS
jgi:hypothetical protein